jgi:hypothetical protein
MFRDIFKNMFLLPNIGITSLPRKEEGLEKQLNIWAAQSRSNCFLPPFRWNVETNSEAILMGSCNSKGH